MADESAKQTALENHLKEDWRTVHNIWPNIGGKSGTMYVSANITSTTPVGANVTGMSFTVAANKAYGFTLHCRGDTSGINNGLRVKFSGPGGATLFRADVFQMHTQPRWEPETITAFDSATTASNWNGQEPMEIVGKLINGANAGTVQMKVVAENNSSTATVGAGSWGEWRLLD
jgi:hypothetical protein